MKDEIDSKCTYYKSHLKLAYCLPFNFRQLVTLGYLDFDTVVYNLMILLLMPPSGMILFSVEMDFLKTLANHFACISVRLEESVQRAS